MVQVVRKNMAPILILLDKPKSEMRELLELFLDKLGYQYQTIEVTDLTTIVALEIVQQSSEFHVLLVYITSSDSPIWSLVKQICESQGEAVPIIGILSFSPEVVGVKYRMWNQYNHLFTDFITIPFGPENLKTLGDLIEKLINKKAFHKERDDSLLSTDEELRSLNSALDGARTAGAPGLGRYAGLCLRYADAVERQREDKRWRFVDEGIGYSANEYLLARIAGELSAKGLLTETFSVIALIRRTEFANAVRSRALPQLADPSAREELRGQLQALSTDYVSDLLTGAEVCGKLGEYAEGLARLGRALDKLAVSGLETGWQAWDRVADILDSYPADDATLEMILRARETVLAADNYGTYPHRIIGLLARFEGQAPLAREILDALPSTPAPGALISPADMASRVRAKRWVERGDWARALESANRVNNLEYRLYTLRDVADVLHRQGCFEPLAQIADLIERVAAETGDWPKNSAAEILIQIGAWERGLDLLRGQRGDYWGRVLDWVDYAEKLLELGEARVANGLLDDALKSVNQLPRDRHQQAYEALAVGMAKAGRYEDALAVVDLLGKESRELVRADVNRYARPSDSHNQALALIEEAKAIAKRMPASKVRASKQHDVLEKVLATGEFQLAWEVLGLLVDTLEQTPAFSKHEFRAGDAAETLLPYVDTHPRVVYGFVTDLLRRDARQSYWQTVHGISATLPLVMAMGGSASLLDLAGFLADWPAGEQGD